MKQGLGNLIVFCLLLTHPLTIYATSDASDFARVNLHVNTHEAYVNEPITITFKATQKEHDHFMLFFVTPKPNSHYTTALLTKSIVEPKPHYNTTTFTYILFAKRAGTLKIAFDVMAKTASDKAVAQAYVEDHDDSVGIDMQTHQLNVTPLTLHIKPLMKDVDLVGDFNLSYTIDKQNIKANESANLIYTIEGRGAIIQLDTLIHSIPHGTLFSELQEREKKLTRSGYKQYKQYIYAITAEENITIAPVTLQAFSPTTKQYYTLHAPELNLSVAPLDIRSLLDEEDAPRSESINWQRIIDNALILFYIAIGFMLARILPTNYSILRASSKYKDITSAKNAKELLQLLILHYDTTRLQDAIAILEAHVYHQQKISLKKVKKEVITELEQSK